MNTVHNFLERALVDYLSRERNKPGSDRPLSGFPSPLAGVAVATVVEAKPIRSTTKFDDLSLTLSDPLCICLELEEKFDLPRIPWQHRCKIPTTEEHVEYASMSDGRADSELTIAGFVTYVADWLERCHPDVVQKLSLVH